MKPSKTQLRDRRVGRFTITRQFMEDDGVWNCGRGAMIELMKRIIVLGAECDFESFNLKYIAISDMFRELDEGERAPKYEIEFSSYNGVLGVRAIEKEGEYIG